MGGFFGGLSEGLSDNIEKKHQEEAASKRQLRDFYLQGAMNPDASEIQQQHAAEEYGKLLHPEARKGWQKVVPYVQKLFGVTKTPEGGGPTSAPSQVSPEEAAAAKKSEPGGFTGQGNLPAGANKIATFNAGPQKKFDTALTPEEEQAFQQWKAQYAPQDSGDDYDLRGAFKAGVTPDPQMGHWPDTFKKPNHPTFSDQSQYAKDAPEKAGQWVGDTYVPPVGAATPNNAAFNKGPVLSKAKQAAQALTGTYPNYDTRTARKTKEDKDQWDLWGTRADELGLKGRDKALFQATHGQHLPPNTIAGLGARKTMRITAPDGTKLDLQQLRDGTFEDLQGRKVEIPEGSQISGPGVNMQKLVYRLKGDKETDPPRMGWVDPRDPKRRLDAQGDPLTMEAEAIDEAAYVARIRAEAYSDAGKFETAFLKQGRSPEQARQMGGALAVATAQKKLDYIGAGHEVLAEDFAGNSVAMPLHKIPTGGVPTAPAAAQPAPVTSTGATQAQVGLLPAAPGAAPAPAGRTPAPAPVARPTPTPAPTGSGVRLLGGVSPTVAKNAALLSGPITGVVLQTFGDPKDPSFKGMASYKDLADNTQSKDRLGQAIKLTLSDFGESLGDASIGGGAGPVHVSSGGFGAWLNNALGMPAKVADQQAQTLRGLLEKMTPREREAYNAEMAQLSMLSGARKVSNSGVAVAYLKLLENEFPKIGINTTDSKSFDDQLNRFAHEVSNFVNTPGVFPRVKGANGKQVPVGISQDMMDYIDSLKSAKPTPAPKDSKGRKPLSAFEK